MKKNIIIILFTLAANTVYAQSISSKPIAIEQICGTKDTTGPYIKQLSDYELVRSLLSILNDKRLDLVNKTTEFEVWLGDQKDCSVWSDGVYLLEIKWIHRESVNRKLTPTMAKILSGDIRLQNNQVEEKINKRWFPWSAWRK